MTVLKAPTPQQMALRTALILFVFVVLFTGFLAAAYTFTRPTIVATEAREKMKLVTEVLPAARYDNDLLKDTLQLPATPELGSDQPTTVYRARQKGQPAALVLEATAPDGYSGKIRMIMAVLADGSVSGVRVLSHKETPGLGDYIEVRKDKNRARPWITQFEGASLAGIPDAEWRVKKDGGRFDAYAGATVTPRAIVKAVNNALKYVEQHRDQLYR